MNKFDTDRNASQLPGNLSRHGYIRWWHSFRGQDAKTGSVRTFFIEYFVINPGLGYNKPILGQMPRYKKNGVKSSYALVKAGVFPDEEGNGGKTICSYHSLSDYQASASPLHLFVGNCECSETNLSGEVYASHSQSQKRYLATDSGSMEWDLEMSKAIACNTGFLGSTISTCLGLLNNFWHGEGIKTYYRGYVNLDGVHYTITPDECDGYADKHWGRNFNSPWIQLACCNLFSERTGRMLKHSALAVDGCTPMFAFIPLKKRLMIQFTYTGEDFEYGFANPFNFSRCKWKIKKTNKRYIWRISGKNKNSLIKISGFCKRSSMMGIKYENPDSDSFTSVDAGGEGVGTIELYRVIDGQQTLIDTIHMRNALWEYTQ